MMMMMMGLGEVVMAVTAFVDFVELGVGSASAGGIVGAVVGMGSAEVVVVELDGWGAEGREAGADDAGAAFDFGPDGGVDGTPWMNGDVS